MYELIIQYGHAAAVAILSGVGLVLMRYVFVLIGSKIVREGLQRLWLEAKKTVLSIEQTYVRALKDGKEDDGKLDAEERAEAKRLAIAELKSNLGKKGLLKLVRILGIDDIDGWLGSTIEAVIGEEKSLGKPQLPAPAQ